jgi:uncharacterized protein YllA (UPF0747 family)
MSEFLESVGCVRLPGGPDNVASVELGQSYTDFLAAHFGEDGLLLLDSRWPEVRAGGHSLWTRYLSRHEALAKAVRERGEELRDQGAEAPLRDETCDHGLFPLEGDSRLPVDANLWETQVRDRLDRGEAERLAPSVLLRGVLQDHLFGTVSHVVGRAEAAYLDQLVPVYEALEVTPPVRVPRMQATVVPRGLLPRERAEEIVADPEAWIAARAQREISPDARNALAAMRRGLEERMSEFAGASGSQDLMQAAESAKRKMLAQIDRLGESLDRRSRRALYRDEPTLRNLPEFLRPHREDQERGLSGASLASYFGDDTSRTVLQAAELHLRCLEEGELHHFFLEGNRE